MSSTIALEGFRPVVGRTRILDRLKKFFTPKFTSPETTKTVREWAELYPNDMPASYYKRECQPKHPPVVDALFYVNELGDTEIVSPQAVDKATTLEQLEIPMLDVPGKPFRVMQDEVTVGLFRKLIEAGYKITGPNAKLIHDQLGKSPNCELEYLSLNDGRAIAKKLNAELGRKFRVPTEEEWKAAVALNWRAARTIYRAETSEDYYQKQMNGMGWEWTETESLSSNGVYVLRSFLDWFNHRPGGYGGSIYIDLTRPRSNTGTSDPGLRLNGRYIRLVEDK
jgi:hypothetical protein